MEMNCGDRADETGTGIDSPSGVATRRLSASAEQDCDW
jgi:hypothetical protein